jgi:hypothetical protein
MENNYFLENNNIDTLWEVISDEDIFKQLSNSIQSNISQIFVKNIKSFFDSEKNKNENLITMNQKYIILILNYIKEHYSMKPTNRIKIHEQPIKESITYEEIQNDRKTIFEKEVIQRQEEFTNAMVLKVPPVPEFADKNKDTPINEIDKIIKEMTTKRNYDIEQINYNYQSDINSANNWLKPQETSIKSEKFFIQNNINDENIVNNINSSNLNQYTIKKNVTWGENNEINDDDNIFKKLKKIETNNNNINIPTNKDNSQQDTEYKITKLESDIKLMNLKIDEILNLLKSK